MEFKIPLSQQGLTYADFDVLRDEFSQKDSIENIMEFEKSICDFINVKSCVALSSGTSAIHLALILLGVKEGDEVICSTLTFVASINPVIYQKAIPIFIDSERKTWNMCPMLLEKAIKDRISIGKKPKAIILVHLYGMPANLSQIMSISKRYNIPVIEDAAEALGSSFRNRKLGTFGEIGVFSFNDNKILTTFGGGALVSNRKEYTERAVFLSTQAKDKKPFYEHSNIGFNYRISSLLATVGKIKINEIEERVQIKRHIHTSYKKKLSLFKDIFFLEEQEESYSNRWLTCIIFKSHSQRERVRLELLKESIECRPLWKPMHLQPILKSYPVYYNGVSEDLFKRGLCLPSGTGITNVEIDKITDIIKRSIIR